MVKIGDQHTSALILLYLATLSRPLYGCLGDLLTAGRVKRLTRERDALLEIGT